MPVMVAVALAVSGYVHNLRGRIGGEAADQARGEIVADFLRSRRESRYDRL